MCLYNFNNLNKTHNIHTFYQVNVILACVTLMCTELEICLHNFHSVYKNQCSFYQCFFDIYRIGNMEMCLYNFNEFNKPHNIHSFYQVNVILASVT